MRTDRLKNLAGPGSLFSFFFYLTLDLSAVWNFLFVPQISPEISCQSHCVALQKPYLSLYNSHMVELPSLESTGLHTYYPILLLSQKQYVKLKQWNK